MQFPINQFEQYIDESVLQRGFSYFNNGYVNSPEEILPGLFEAIVEGSEDYIVKLQLEKDKIVDFSCTCPYDFGPVCKHIAALIFCLQQEDLNLSTGKGKKAAKKSKSKTIAEQVNELLKKISYEELIIFIKEQCVNNILFRQLFLSNFGHLSSEESLDFYKKQINSILNTAKDRHGFINWSAARTIRNQVGEMINQAYRYFEEQNYKSAALICFAIMEEMTDALQFADDSNADIGENIYSAYSLLNDMASEENLPEGIRKLIYDYCINAYNNNIYFGWEWHLDILSIAAELFTTGEEANRVIELLDKPGLSEYEENQKQVIKLDILLKTKGNDTASEFIEKNLANPEVRKIAIEKAMNDKNFNRAIEIAEDGIKNDVKLPGLVMDWYDWLLKIAIATGDKVKIINYARKLFIESIHEKSQYYKIMKDNIDKAKWYSFVEDLILDMNKYQSWSSFYDIAQIFITEQWWNRLLELLKSNPTLNNISSYEEHLSQIYPAELADLYIQAINNEKSICTTRKQYRNLCRYIRRIKKLGEAEKAKLLIEKLRRENPRKKALLEELNNV